MADTGNGKQIRKHQTTHDSRSAHSPHRCGRTGVCATGLGERASSLRQSLFARTRTAAGIQRDTSFDEPILLSRDGLQLRTCGAKAGAIRRRVPAVPADRARVLYGASAIFVGCTSFNARAFCDLFRGARLRCAQRNEHLLWLLWSAKRDLASPGRDAVDGVFGDLLDIVGDRKPRGAKRNLTTRVVFGVFHLSVFFGEG